MNYTPHQQEAIAARGEDLLISAAAGSGKTRVLVDRIIDMLAHDHVELAHMLIVTFTNAAAGEMKARLRQGLAEAVGVGLLWVDWGKEGAMLRLCRHRGSRGKNTLS